MSQKKDSIVIKTHFNEIGKAFKNARKNLESESQKAMNLIDSNTKNEKKVLESAYDAYNKKVDSIVESKEYKNIEEKATNFSKELNTNLMKAFKEFNKVKEQIMAKDWTDEKKNKKIKEVYEYVIKKLYDQDEIDRFNNMMQNTIIIGSSSEKKDLLEM